MPTLGPEIELSKVQWHAPDVSSPGVSQPVAAAALDLLPGPGNESGPRIDYARKRPHHALRHDGFCQGLKALAAFRFHLAQALTPLGGLGLLNPRQVRLGTRRGTLRDDEGSTGSGDLAIGGVGSPVVGRTAQQPIHNATAWIRNGSGSLLRRPIGLEHVGMPRQGRVFVEPGSMQPAGSRGLRLHLGASNTRPYLRFQRRQVTQRALVGRLSIEAIRQRYDRSAGIGEGVGQSASVIRRNALAIPG